MYGASLFGYVPFGIDAHSERLSVAVWLHTDEAKFHNAVSGNVYAGRFQV
jgi:hypothetical protein